MKKSNVLILLLVLAFDILFYHQIPGINVLIFCLLFVAYCLLTKPKLKTDKSWQLTAVISIFSSVLVGIYGNALSLISCFISFSLLAAYTAEKKSSLWVAVSGFVLSYIRSPVTCFKLLQLQFAKWNENKENQNLAKFGIMGIVLVVVLIFFFIYRNSSLLFYQLTQKINFNFISFYLIIFTLNAWFIIIAFKKYSPIKKFQLLFDKPSKILEEDVIKTEDVSKRISLEQLAAVLLLSSLNGLLIIVNILDIGFLINRKLPQGVSYSDFIHQGIGMLIVSILLAVSIILYFFRKDLNFTNNKWLKILSYTWVFQNLFMLLSNISRNSMYIEAYGLTEKRIGVYFYLLLAAIGLFTTIIKIYKKQSNAYLVRSTSMIFFVILLISSTISWDYLITRHDLSRNDADYNFSYLTGLSYTNIPQLLEYVEKNKPANEDSQILEKTELLYQKTLNFVYNYNENPNWQSFNYMRNKIYNEVITRKIPYLYLNYANNQQLEGIKYLPNIEELTIKNSTFKSTDGLKRHNVKRLTLANCNLSDINFIYTINNLEYLNLSGNNIKSYVPLYHLKNLKELHIYNADSVNMSKLKLMLPNTKIY